jgi:hypothetical protein
MANKGDIIGDCVTSTCTGKVIYDGGNEGVCNSCGLVYEVSNEEESTPPPPPPAPLPPPAPPAPPTPVELPIPIPVVVVDGQSPIGDGLGASEAEGVAKSLGLPDHILKSRPWRWAYEFCKSGNPYRSDTKSFKIFSEIEKSGPLGITPAELALKVEMSMGEKASYLLSVYEVVSQGVAAGLLIMNQISRKVTVCLTNPRPAKVP